jgi:propionyl-CoA carboxylase alpha chain
MSETTPPFRKILIANRGEIACRIIRTARRMGIATVAVYSDADRNALHVEMADEAVRIGPPPAAESYLRIDRILDAARATGAEAIHPGFGFLSENPAFVRACEEAGIVFIGPNARAIELMGDKIQSKKCAREAGVSIVPGHVGEIADAEEAVRIAGEIGYPVMIKASAGGGGKGMRIARTAAEVREGFAAARSEARASFGDDRVFIEKFIENPRHVEIQVLADRHGNVIYLGERECSIQRRNQKVVEEAPSPLLDEATRRAMGEQAVRVAQAVGYDSAGTVEFVAGQDRSFYFLEMNTRLQVEHPVTELVTGLDLVELMIRVAAGEKLPLAQEDVALKGWAVETRVYAEDPERGFLPSTGRLRRFLPPREEAAAERIVRLDTGVREGDEISMFYDPMIAKLITWAPDRERAIEAQADALDAFFIDGIRSNIAFLSAIMENPRFREGRLSTGFIEEEFPEGFSGAPAKDEVIDVLVAAAAAMDHLENLRRRRISGQLAGERVSFSADRVVWFEESRRGVPVHVEHESDRLIRIRCGDECERVVEQEWHPGLPVWRGRINGREVHVQVRRVLNGYRLTHRGVTRDIRVYTPREAELAALMPVREAPDTSRQLICPMPGRVLSIAVREGQTVKAGEPLCVVEAMKMENILRAERDVIVSAIRISEGEAVSVDQVLMEFELPG